MTTLAPTSSSVAQNSSRSDFNVRAITQNLRTSEPEPQNSGSSEPQNLRTPEPRNPGTPEPLKIPPPLTETFSRCVRIPDTLKCHHAGEVPAGEPLSSHQLGAGQRHQPHRPGRPVFPAASSSSLAPILMTAQR